MDALNPQSPASNPSDERKDKQPVPFERRRRNFHEFKGKIHQAVINKIDLDLLVKFDSQTAHVEVAKIVNQLINQSSEPLSLSEKQMLVEEVVNETFGLGPLEPLLADPSVDDILVNDYCTVFIERRGKLVKTDVAFKDNSHLRHIINRIVSKVGRRIDESSPMVDARLADGSRVNAVIPPLALNGPSLSIRRFKKIPFKPDDYVRNGAISLEMLELLKTAVHSRMNIIVSGGTGAGKTTLMNVISSSIPPEERIITIEDAAELQLQQPHVVRLETRPPNVEGKGGITQRELFINTLRMRPDRIIVGEVRSVEALEMLQAMNTGHDGSMTTVHANTPRDAITRIETMVMMGSNLDQVAIRRQIASAIQLIVQVKRYPDGVRRIESICEITGMEQNVISMQDIAGFVVKGMGPDGKIIGDFAMHAIRPKFINRARDMGTLSRDDEVRYKAFKGAA